jgi:MORN repeat variant
MKRIKIFTALILYCTLIKAQFVRSLYKEDNEIKDELADFSLKDISSLQEMSVSKDNGEAVCVFKHTNWTDSSKYDNKTNRFTFWRNKTILVEGDANPNEEGNAGEGGARKGTWIFRHDNGETLAKGKYDDYGNKIDKWLFYYPNKQLRKVENYLLFDNHLTWDIDSNKIWQVVESKKHGEYLEYHENGQIKIRGKYKSEIILKDSAYLIDYQELDQIPDPSMQRYTKGFIIATKKIDKWLYYDDKGILVKEEDYD